MNRAERRKQGVTWKPKTYVLTEGQIATMKQNAVDEATRKAFLMFMSIPVMILHDKFGFGKRRLGKVMDYALIWYEAIQSNEVQLMELVKVAEEECGIKTLFWEGNNDNHASRSNHNSG